MSLVDPSTGEVVVLLDEREARDLTDRIKAATESLWALLLEAHERQAWRALGYETWESYVRAEFDMSRQRAYQLLDQGAVTRAISAAVSTTVDITEREARDLKPHLAEVVGIVRDRTAGVTREKVAEVVREVVAEERAKAKQRAESAAVFDELAPDEWGPAEKAADEALMLQRGALNRLCRDLAALGDPAELVAAQRGWLNETHIENAVAAHEWLTAFLAEMEA